MEGFFSDPAKLLIGGGLIAAVAAGWGHIKSVIAWVRSSVFVTANMEAGANDAVMAYIRHKYRTSKFGTRTFVAWRLFVRPLFRREYVPLETLGGETRIFWKGWLPIWASRSKAEQDKESSWHYRPVTLAFFRGTLNVDNLVRDSVDFFNGLNQGDNGNRYKIKYIHGSGNKPTQINTGNHPLVDGNDNRYNNSYLEESRSCRFLKWGFSEVGPMKELDSNPLSRLWLGDGLQSIADEISDWMKSRDWHIERGVPWKRGYGLYGEPGTGKTCFVRAIAEHHDLPVFVYDLATLHNDELRSAWTNMMANTPCIALFEDVDSVFNKRKTTHGHLTFDALLNCLDGVERSDGLLVFVTSNDPSKLDPAIGGGGKFSSRPGRVDRVLQTKRISEAGRRYIAKRVFKDADSEQVEAVVFAGKDETAAEFERRCVVAVNELRWSGGDAVQCDIEIRGDRVIPVNQNGSELCQTKN